MLWNFLDTNRPLPFRLQRIANDLLNYKLDPNTPIFLSGRYRCHASFHKFGISSRCISRNGTFQIANR